MRPMTEAERAIAQTIALALYRPQNNPQNFRGVGSNPLMPNGEINGTSEIVRSIDFLLSSPKNDEGITVDDPIVPFLNGNNPMFLEIFQANQVLPQHAAFNSVKYGNPYSLNPTVNPPRVNLLTAAIQCCDMHLVEYLIKHKGATLDDGMLKLAANQAEQQPAITGPFNESLLALQEKLVSDPIDRPGIYKAKN